MTALAETVLKRYAGLEQAEHAVHLDDLQKRFRDNRELVRKHNHNQGLMDEKPQETDDDMGIHVGDIVINNPGNTVKETSTTHTTDTAAVATAVESVVSKAAVVHNSPLTATMRNLLYAAVGTSLLGNVVAIPAALYAMFRDPAPAAATATVNVPAATTEASKPVDTDTDTTTQYELELVPN